MTGLEPKIDLVREHVEPGGELQGGYRIDPELLGGIKSLELSVYWMTEGKGDEDRAEYYRESKRGAEAELCDRSGMGQFSIPLPTSPLSYEGILIKIIWLIRVRIETFSNGVLETSRSFCLGNVAAINEVES